MSSCHYLLPGKPASRKPRKRRSLRLLAAVITIALAAAALLVQAPVAGQALPVSNVTPQIGPIPFTGDAYTLDPQGNLIPVSSTLTPTSAPLYNRAGDPMNLTWGSSPRRRRTRPPGTSPTTGPPTHSS
jgi:hypothetical protein